MRVCPFSPRGRDVLSLPIRRSNPLVRSFLFLVEGTERATRISGATRDGGVPVSASGCPGRVVFEHHPGASGGLTEPYVHGGVVPDNLGPGGRRRPPGRLQ